MMNLLSKFSYKSFLFLLLAINPATAMAESYFENPVQGKSLDFLPFPIFNTLPDSGSSYGLNPVIQLTDRDTKLTHLSFGLLGQWNKTVGWSGGASAQIFPHPNQDSDAVIETSFEWGQDYLRDVRLRFFDPHFADNHFVSFLGRGLQSPFARFYGFGPSTLESSESNYVSEAANVDATWGYWFTNTMRVNYTANFQTLDVEPRALTKPADTLTAFAADSRVADSTTLFHKVSFSYDTRDKYFFTTKGTLLEASYGASVDGLISTAGYHGYSLEALQFLPWLEGRTITAIRFYTQDLYGSAIPFTVQSRLGGNREMRGFMPGRFTDHSKAILAIEQRIKVFEKEIFNFPLNVWIDPFIEFGKVFNNLDDAFQGQVQISGGIGARIYMPPNFVMRIDTAFSKEAVNFYTTMDYPF